MARPKGTKNSPNARKTGPKNGRGRTPTEVQSHRARIQDLDVKGYSQNLIAKELGLSQPMVCLELKAIRQEYHDAYVDDRKAMVMAQTARLYDVLRQSQLAIDRINAKGKRKKVKEELVGGESGGYSKTSESQEDGSIAEYLKIRNDAIQQLTRLWGLEELPKAVFNVQVNNTSDNVFDRLLTAILGGEASQAETPAIVLDGSNAEQAQDGGCDRPGVE